MDETYERVVQDLLAASKAAEAIGFAVNWFEPSELRGADPVKVTEGMTDGGWNAIDNYGEDEDE